MTGNVLGIDRGSKKVGLAYLQAVSRIVFPVGRLENNSDLSASLSDIIARYKISKVVLGIPTTSHAKKHIEALQYIIASIDPHIPIHFVDEAYTSVQADAVLGTTHEHPGQDTVAAMLLLEVFVNTQS